MRKRSGLITLFIIVGSLGHPAAALSATYSVDTLRSETIAASPAYAAWTGTYGWNSRFTIDLGTAITATLALYSSQPATVRVAWEQAIENKWDGRLRLASTGISYPFVVRVAWVADPTAADYTVTSLPAGARNGGAGTDSIANWGPTDTFDVPHEVGHMLGAMDEYFVVNGTDYGAPNYTSGGLMNYAGGIPQPRNIALVAQALSADTGQAFTTATALPKASSWTRSGRRRGDRLIVRRRRRAAGRRRARSGPGPGHRSIGRGLHAQ